MKGFIKTGGTTEKKKKRKKKGAKTIVYESVARLPAHDKWECEADDLMAGLDLEPVELDEESEELEEDVQQASGDKRKMLMQMLEQQGKSVFRFEEEDGANALAPAAKKDERKRGRPKKEKEGAAEEMNMDSDDLEEEDY